MNTLLPPTSNRRKTKVVILHAELYRERGAANWRLAVRHNGKRTMVFDTFTPLESAAREFATITIRNLTRPAAQQPSSPAAQQPSSPAAQQPSSPAATNLI